MATIQDLDDCIAILESEAKQLERIADHPKEINTSGLRYTPSEYLRFLVRNSQDAAKALRTGHGSNGSAITSSQVGDALLKVIKLFDEDVAAGIAMAAFFDSYPQIRQSKSNIWAVGIRLSKQ